MATSAIRSATGTGASTAVPVDYHNIASSPVTAQLDYVTGTGVGTVSVEGTVDNLQDPTVTPVWIALPSLSGLSAAAIVPIVVAVRAVRLNCTAYTSGTISLKVLQGDAN